MKITAFLFLAAWAFAQNLDQLYDYDRSSQLKLEEKEMQSHGGYKISSIKYALPKGGAMSGFLIIPNGAARKPGIVWMHSGGAIQFLGDAVLMAKAGAASILLGPAEDLQQDTAEMMRNQ